MFCDSFHDVVFNWFNIMIMVGESRLLYRFYYPKFYVSEDPMFVLQGGLLIVLHDLLFLYD